VRRFVAAVALMGALVISVAPARAGDPPAARVDPNFPPFRSVMPGAGGPPTPNYVVPAPRPQIYCDTYGRCWQQVPSQRSQKNSQRRDWGYDQRPGWGYDQQRPHRDPYGFNGSD